MASILILSLVFPPDAVSTAQIMGELAIDLKKCGHQVTVVTTRPHFNRDYEVEAKQPITPIWGPLLGKSDFSGIPAFHTFMPRKGRSVAGRLLGWAGFHALSTAAAFVMAPRPDVILCPSPPLTVGVSAWLVGLLRRCPFVYNVQEIYPDIAINLGVLTSRPVIWVLRALERWVYMRAAAITVIAPRMLENLRGKGVPPGKLRVIPNFVDTEDLHPGPKSNDFSRGLGISDKFVVTYAGNLGPAQGLATVVEAADLLREVPDIHFLMMGGGTSETELGDMVARLGLPNLTLLPYHPYSMMLQVYSASDVCLVPQALETGSDAVPSKVYRIMSCGRAVLAVTEPASDLSRLVLEAGCGVSVRAKEPSQLASAIERLYRARSQCAEMGLAGRRFVLGAGSRFSVTRQYHELLCDVAMRKAVSITE